MMCQNFTELFEMKFKAFFKLSLSRHLPYFTKDRKGPMILKAGDFISGSLLK